MIVLKEGHLTEKSDDRVEHLNTILAQMGRNLNDPTNLQKFRCPGFALGGRRVDVGMFSFKELY